MSTRQHGNARENRICVVLEAMGYCCYPSRGSRGVDVIANHTEFGHPHLRVAVMRPGHGNLSEEFAKLNLPPVPAGSVAIVAREVTKTRIAWYARADHRGGHTNATDAIEEARSL